MRLVLLAALLACASARATRSKGSAAPLQYVGDVLEWRTPNRPDYLRNQQIVGVMAPGSGGVRVPKKRAGLFEGVSRRQGVVWHMKTVEKPLVRNWFDRKAPFKVRMLKLNKERVVGALVESEQVAVELMEVPTRGRDVRCAASVRLVKKKAWYRKLL